MSARANPPGPVAAPASSRPPPSPPPREPAEERSRPGVPLVLAAAAVLAALLGGRASLLSSDASGAFQSSVRLQVRDSALVLEEVRYLFQVEGGHALAVILAEERVAALRAEAEEADADVRDELLVEASAQEILAEQLIESAGTELLTDPRYRLEGGGYDLGLRLADTFESSEGSPAERRADADSQSRQSVRLIAITIPVALAFALGALAQAFAARRRVLLTTGAVLLVASAALFTLAEVTA